jgi:hypothetical protein
MSVCHVPDRARRDNSASPRQTKTNRVISKRAAASIVLIAGPMAVCLFGGIVGLDPVAVVFVAFVQFLTGAWLYWLGCQDGP